MRYLALAAVGLCLVSCETIAVSYNPYDQEVRPASDFVSVYFDAADVSRPYDEIGVILVDDQGWGYSETRLISKMKSEAKKAGADAVIIDSQDGSLSGAMLIDHSAALMRKTVIRGVAIKFKQDIGS